jgi:hypothetical protein
MNILLKVTFLAISFGFLQGVQLYAQVKDQKLEDAVSALRNIKGETLTDEQKEESAKRIDLAWKTLIDAGTAGAARLKEEIQKVDVGKEKDDFFKLNATVVIWEIGKASEANYIAEVWSSTPISAQYTYVFLTAFQAAQTQDPKVLPMLRVILKDNEGEFFVWQHSMNVAWPLSHEFIWGVYGPAGLPVLAEILATSEDVIEKRSAMLLLSRAQYLPALPIIRKFIASPNELIRGPAIMALGRYGHPDDYEMLVSGFDSYDSKELFFYVYAMSEFGDRRPVPRLIPLLDKGDDGLALQAFTALLHLLTPDAFTAAKVYASKVKDTKLKEYLEQQIYFIQKELPDNFERMPEGEQSRLLAEIRNKDLVLPIDAAEFSNKDLKEALYVWREKGRIYRSGYAWVGVSKLISAATPDDLELLLSTKAAFYRRLSDECLYEVRDFDRAIKHIGRSRYRSGLGVTDKAISK